MSVWRVGRKLGRTLYRDEVCVGMVDTPEIAAEIVARLNGAWPEHAIFLNELAANLEKPSR